MHRAHLFSPNNTDISPLSHDKAFQGCYIGSMPTIHCHISGRVQGVWFRGWAQKTALAMGVTGWVRNLADGRVECKASADEATLKQFISKLGQGPPFSRVERLECVDTPEGKEFQGFRIAG